MLCGGMGQLDWASVNVFLAGIVVQLHHHHVTVETDSLQQHPSANATALLEEHLWQQYGKALGFHAS